MIYGRRMSISSRWVSICSPHQNMPGVDRYVTPEEFEEYAAMARAKGFTMVSASPLTRSSYHAGDDFAQLRANRLAELAQNTQSGVLAKVGI